MTTAPTRMFAARPRTSRGMTLIEILIAAAISMIVILAVVEIIRQAGNAVSNGRAAIEMAGQIRRVGEQFRDDLAMATVPTKPWPSDEAATGYLEIFEGPIWDGQTAGTPLSTFGDNDDVIMFTARSPGKPFVGFLNGVQIESHLAEIIWWTTPRTGSPGKVTLYRRVLLIRPDLTPNLSGYVISPPTMVNNLATYYNNNDVSVHVNGTALVANSLADLTKRENRLGHFAVSGLLYPLNGPFIVNAAPNGILRTNDIALSNVSCFDVKVFDPTAIVNVVNGRALDPADPGYLLPTATPVGAGAFVDLGYKFTYRAGATASRFSGAPAGNAYLPPVAPLPKPSVGGCTFCTWSSHYERNGVDEDGDGVPDEGTDGLDNDNSNGVDDANEQETSPPYPYPLRSLQVKIRMTDINTQKVRQVTVQQDFLRE